ncbi:MAG: DUF1127 domain-containing protein [Pseudomonas sp.]|uniref:DUF1127 domain-containing protein n=1 Tax=Pseudomonas sp. TaxID=306 RepID=UPI003D0DD691
MKGQKGYAIAGAMPHQVVSLAAPFRVIWRQLMRWQQLMKERRQLASLSDGALKDIGLSRADVLQESERSFWDDPLRSE